MAYINKMLKGAMESLDNETSDGGGWWLYYKPGWIDTNLECHMAHEDTKAEVIRMADPVPCYCDDRCREARRKIDDDETFKTGVERHDRHNTSLPQFHGD